MCRCLDLKFGNGRFGNDNNIGNFTCISNQGCSTVDYCIASSELFPYFENFTVDIVAAVGYRPSKNRFFLHNLFSLLYCAKIRGKYIKMTLLQNSGCRAIFSQKSVFFK